MLAVLWVAGVASAANLLTPDGEQGVAATIVSSPPSVVSPYAVDSTTVTGPIVTAYGPVVSTVTAAPPIAAPVATKTVGATYTAPSSNSIVFPEFKTYSPPVVAAPVITKSAPSYSYQSFTTHSVSRPIVAQRLNAPTIKYGVASPSVARAYLPPVTQGKATPLVTAYVVEPARVKAVSPAYSSQNFHQVFSPKKTVVTPAVVTPVVAAKTVSTPVGNTYAAPVVSAPVAVAAKTVTTYTAPAAPVELASKTIEAPAVTYAAGPAVTTYSVSAPTPVQYASSIPVRYVAALPVQYANYAVSGLDTPAENSYTTGPTVTYTADPATYINAPGITYTAPLSGASYISDPSAYYSSGHTKLSYSDLPGVSYSVIPAGYNTAPAVSAYASAPEGTYANIPWTLNAAAPAYAYINYGAEYPFKKKK